MRSRFAADKAGVVGAPLTWHQRAGSTHPRTGARVCQKSLTNFAGFRSGKMRKPTFAHFENLKIPEETQVADAPIPDDIPLIELADQVVRGKIKLNPQQMRMLIEILPYMAPKLCIERSGKAQVKPKQLMIEDLRGR
jgi:hypothetical protein